MSAKYPPRIAAAKRVAEQFDFDAVIVIGFDGPEVFNVFSYGRNGAICCSASRVTDLIALMLKRGDIGVDDLQDAIEVSRANCH